MSHLGRARVVVKNPNKNVLDEALKLLVTHCEQYAMNIVNGVIRVTDTRTNQTVVVKCTRWSGIEIVASTEYQKNFGQVSSELQRHIKRFYNARSNILAVQKMGMQAQIQYGTEEEPEKIRIVAFER